MPTCGKHPDGSSDVTCHLCHAAALVDKAVEEGRIGFASAVVTDRYTDEIKVVLDALGLEGALITDESLVGHFDHLDLDGETPEARLSRVLGFGVVALDYIIDVAKRVRTEGGIDGRQAG